MNETMSFGSSFEDAVAFVNAVMVRFEPNREKYKKFLQILNDFKADIIDRRVVKLEVYELFKDHKDLIFRFNKFMPTEYEIKLPLNVDNKYDLFQDALAYVQRLKDEFQDKFDRFLEIVMDFKAGKIGTTEVMASVKELFKEHPDLILGFNVFLPKGYRIQIDETGDRDDVLTAMFNRNLIGEKMKEEAENCEISWDWDVLDVICKRLDFDDQFRLASVCKNWREFHKSYWRTFLAFQEPLLIIQETSRYGKSVSFVSIPDQKVYHSKMVNKFWNFAYCGSSSRYLIMTTKKNSFLLMSPFTRKKKVINSPDFKVNFSSFAYNVLLAFGKGSNEFVLVALCNTSDSLHVYQSRNSGWVTYLTKGKPWKVVDFVVFNDKIYVITDKAKIGVLCLNSADINFLELKSTPSVTSSSHLRLVSCDGQLLVVHITNNKNLNVYKIDFSTKNYVKMETLGDITLFHASGRYYYALSNPVRWGYERNSLYVINTLSKKCYVCLGDDKNLPKYIRHDRLQTTPEETPYLLDWCFRHLHYEVDYSLVE